MSEFSGEHGRAPCGIDDPTRKDGAIAAIESGAEEEWTLLRPNAIHFVSR
jgi:hypothetical protein